MSDRESLSGEIVDAQRGQLWREPGRIDEGDATGAQRPQPQHRRDGGDGDRDAAGTCLQALAEHLVIRGAAHVAGAGEGEPDGVQWGGGEELRSVVDQRRVGESAHRLQGDGGVHQASGPHHPQRHACGVDGDAGGAMAASSDSEPMAACGTRMPSRARNPQPSGCHIHASCHIQMEYVRSARLAIGASSIAGTTA